MFCVNNQFACFSNDITLLTLSFPFILIGLEPRGIQLYDEHGHNNGLIILYSKRI